MPLSCKQSADPRHWFEDSLDLTVELSLAHSTRMYTEVCLPRAKEIPGERMVPSEVILKAAMCLLLGV